MTPIGLLTIEEPQSHKPTLHHPAGKIVLRNYISATIGFVELAEVTHRSPKSLMRMLGPQGNPQAQNLFAIVYYWRDREGIQFELRATAVS